MCVAVEVMFRNLRQTEGAPDTTMSGSNENRPLYITGRNSGALLSYEK